MSFLDSLAQFNDAVNGFVWTTVSHIFGVAFTLRASMRRW